MNKKIDISDLSDLDIEKLPDGFTVIFDGDEPVAVISNYKYYQYLSTMMHKVKEYVQDKID